MHEDPAARIRTFDRYLKRLSWDATWSRMLALVNDVALSPPRRSCRDAAVAVSLMPLRRASRTS